MAESVCQAALGVSGTCGMENVLCFRERGTGGFAGSPNSNCNSFCGEHCAQAMETLIEGYKNVAKSTMMDIIHVEFQKDGDTSSYYPVSNIMSQRPSGATFFLYVKDDGKYKPIWPPAVDDRLKPEAFRDYHGRASILSQQLCAMRAKLQDGEEMVLRFDLAVPLEKMTFTDDQYDTLEKRAAFIASLSKSKSYKATVMVPDGMALYTSREGWGIRTNGVRVYFNKYFHITGKSVSAIDSHYQDPKDLAGEHGSSDDSVDGVRKIG